MESFSRDCRFYSPVWMRWWVKVTSANTMSRLWTRKGKFPNQTQVFEILVKLEIRLKALEENANLNIHVNIFSYDLLQAWMSILKPSMQIYKWTDGTTQAECIWIHHHMHKISETIDVQLCIEKYVERNSNSKSTDYKRFSLHNERIERIRRAIFMLKLKLKSA